MESEPPSPLPSNPPSERHRVNGRREDHRRQPLNSVRGAGPEGMLLKHLTSTAPDSNGPPNLIPLNPIRHRGYFKGGSAGEDALGMHSDGSGGVKVGF